VEHITTSALKRLSIDELRDKLPLAIVTDDTVFAVIQDADDLLKPLGAQPPPAPALPDKVTCPNCGTQVTIHKEPKPYVFTLKKPSDEEQARF